MRNNLDVDLLDTEETVCFNGDMPTTPVPCPTADWFTTHCYHCGRLNEDIILDGPTEGCLCDAGQDTPLSTIESEALREANA